MKKYKKQYLQMFPKKTKNWSTVEHEKIMEDTLESSEKKIKSSGGVTLM